MKEGTAALNGMREWQGNDSIDAAVVDDRADEIVDIKCRQVWSEAKEPAK